MDVIDCFATDHAPHTLEEKDSEILRPDFRVWKLRCHFYSLRFMTNELLFTRSYG